MKKLTLPLACAAAVLLFAVFPGLKFVQEAQPSASQNVQTEKDFTKEPVTAHKSGSFPYYSYEDLLREAPLIVRAEFSSVSEPFYIQAVNGSITQDEYDELLQEANTYATII